MQKYLSIWQLYEWGFTKTVHGYILLWNINKLCFIYSLVIITLNTWVDTKEILR